jgi:hypothetical protein
LRGEKIPLRLIVTPNAVRGLLLSVEEGKVPSSNSTQKRKTAEIPHFVRNDTKKKVRLSE